MVRRERDAGRQHRDGRDERRAERDRLRPHLGEMVLREQPARRVAGRHADDGERAEDLRLRLRADEQRHADEPDRDTDEPPAR